MTENQLNALLVQRIQAKGPITFTEFMETVLYDPQAGYYSHHKRIGPQGDYYTAPHLAADFGELLGEQVVELWQILGQPQPFTLVEMGAGQGILARDILTFITRKYPDFGQALDYVIIERSDPDLTLPGVRWSTLEDLAPFVGTVISNELVDAFPVHRVQWVDQQLREIYVTCEQGILTEVSGELSTPKLTNYFERVGITFDERYPAGYHTEVNLAAINWLSTLATKLQRGYVLTIDYGYSAQRYYLPNRHTGTLLAYRNHQLSENFYQFLGEQDLTAHVDFTALEYFGNDVEFTKVGFTQQGLFLMGLGLGERLTQLRESTLPLPESMGRYQALHSLIHPTGLGGFGVLVQGRGLTTEQLAQPLKGLQFSV